MKKNHLVSSLPLVCAMLVSSLAIFVSPVAAESMFETYASASRTDLEIETREMGQKLTTAFNQQTIADYQQRINFAEYFSGLKKAVFYAGKLASYTEYEKDLQFARDKEVFKGLPEQDGTANGKEVTTTQDRKEYVAGKYERMTKNVEEEIETYIDMMQISLDACESLAVDDLDGMFDHEDNRKKILSFCGGKEFRVYAAKKDDFSRRWAELSERIDSQVALWQPKVLSPTDPLIDRRITGAL